MKNSAELNRYFNLAETIDYDNREGGRYAFVQLMSYIREIRLVLIEEQNCSPQIGLLDIMSEELNELVSERFTIRHKMVFDQCRIKLKVMRNYLFRNFQFFENKTTDDHSIKRFIVFGKPGDRTLAAG